MTEPILRISDIYCYYDSIQAIQGVSLDVREGEIVAIIGANGAGKSTLMKSVAGIVHPKSGSIIFEGEDITLTPAHRMIYKGISYNYQIGRASCRERV